MIRVASYNIRKCVGLDWRRDPFRIARVVAQIDADIVALQESDKRLGSRPAALPPEALAETGLEPLGVDNGPSLGWHGNAILARPGWSAGTIHRLDLPGLEPRGALLAEVATRAGPVLVAATHLGLDRRSRQRQLATIRAAAGADRLPRTILLGDMNEWSEVRGFAPLDRDLNFVAPGPSFHAGRPLACLDRIAVGRDWTVRRTGVWRTPLSRHASDHLPVWAEIEPA